MAKVTGTIKWFSNRKGYGFVTPSNGGEDVFVHYSVLQVKEGSFRGLHAEDEIEFTIEHDKEKGKDMATNVTYPNGALIDLPYRSREERAERAKKRAEERGEDGKQEGEGNRGRNRGRKRRPRKPRNDDNDEAGADDPIASAKPIERDGAAIKGTVKWFSYRKGYGFVTRQDNSEDVFVHRRFLISPLAMPIVVEEQEVEFTEGKDDSGRSIATQVTAPGGLPLPKKRRPRRPRNEDDADAAANNSEKKE